MYIYLGTLRSSSQSLGIVESFSPLLTRDLNLRRGGEDTPFIWPEKNWSKVWQCCRPGSCCLVVSCDSALSQVQAGRSYFTSKEEIILWKLDIFFLPSPLFHASVLLCLTSSSIALEFIFLALSRMGISLTPLHPLAIHSLASRVPHLFCSWAHTLSSCPLFPSV